MIRRLSHSRARHLYSYGLLYAAYILTAYVVMAYVVMAYVVMDVVIMAYAVTAYIVMTYVILGYIVMVDEQLTRLFESSSHWHAALQPAITI